MYLVKIKYLIVAIVAIATIIITFSFYPKKNKQMQQVYYTQEGTPYILKAITVMGNFNVAPANTPLAQYIRINKAPSGVLGTINLNTSKKFVPLIYSAGYTNNVVANYAPFIDIQSIYWYKGSSITPGNIGEGDGLSALVKSIPYGKQLFYTDRSNYRFSLEYSQIVLSDSDFLDPSNSFDIVFVNGLPWALNGRHAAQTNFANIPGPNNGQYAQTFIYFELQK